MWNKIAITLFLINELSQVHCTEDCESLKNCQQCIRAPSCGWYLQYRSTNGSGCFEKTHLHKHKTNPMDGHTHPPDPTIYVKNEANSLVSPQEVSLNLRLNEPFSFPVTFRQDIEGKTSIELVQEIKKPRIVKIKFFTNCSGQHDDLIETNRCDNIEFGSSVEFVVKVEQVSCSRRQPQKIKRFKIKNDNAIFRLNLYAYCYCPCEMENRRSLILPEVTPYCRGKGSFICGVCYCKDGYEGDDCEINTTNSVSS